MATVIWDSHGIISVQYLEKDKTINVEHYANLLQQLSDKRSQLAKKKALFHQNNPPTQIFVQWRINPIRDN